MLAAWASTEPEVHGLVALTEVQSSRLNARVGAAGPWCRCGSRTGAGGIAYCPARLSRPAWSTAAGRPSVLQAPIGLPHRRAAFGGHRLVSDRYKVAEHDDLLARRGAP